METIPRILDLNDFSKLNAKDCFIVGLPYYISRNHSEQLSNMKGTVQAEQPWNLYSYNVEMAIIPHKLHQSFYVNTKTATGFKFVFLSYFDERPSSKGRNLYACGGVLFNENSVQTKESFYVDLEHKDVVTESNRFNFDKCYFVYNYEEKLAANTYLIKLISFSKYLPLIKLMSGYKEITNWLLYENNLLPISEINKILENPIPGDTTIICQNKEVIIPNYLQVFFANPNPIFYINSRFAKGSHELDYNTLKRIINWLEILSKEYRFPNYMELFNEESLYDLMCVASYCAIPCLEKYFKKIEELTK